jgi:ankyrin repeat protein
VVELLLKINNINLDPKDNYGQTPLSFAAADGYDAVELLLAMHGIDIDSKDKYGQTPL